MEINITECFCKIGYGSYLEDIMNVNYVTNFCNAVYKEIAILIEIIMDC